MDVSIYIADAPFQRLPLIGGSHDWAYLLGPAAFGNRGRRRRDRGDGEDGRCRSGPGRDRVVLRGSLFQPGAGIEGVPDEIGRSGAGAAPLG